MASWRPTSAVVTMAAWPAARPTAHRIEWRIASGWPMADCPASKRHHRAVNASGRALKKAATSHAAPTPIRTWRRLSGSRRRPLIGRG